MLTESPLEFRGTCQAHFKAYIHKLQETKQSRHAQDTPPPRPGKRTRAGLINTLQPAWDSGHGGKPRLSGRLTDDEIGAAEGGGRTVLSFLGGAQGTWKFPGQGSNLSHSRDLRHSCSNTGSLAHCTTGGTRQSFQQMVLCEAGVGMGKK